MHASIRSSLSACQLQDIAVSDDDIIQAILLLKSGKSDSLGQCACPAIVEDFFTACLRHGTFLPHSILDCVIVPVPKSASCNQNYRPITLAPTLSKAIEQVILLKFGSYLHSSHLQYGFKAGSSTYCFYKKSCVSLY